MVVVFPEADILPAPDTTFPPVGAAQVECAMGKRTMGTKAREVRR